MNNKKRDLIPYGRHEIQDEDINAVIKILKSDSITQGKSVEEFEQNISSYVNSEYAIATNSATSALILSYMALGLAKDDILWTSANTFIATSNAALICGAKVDFIDINPKTYNIDINELSRKLEIANISNKLPKIVVPVHFAGQSCEMKKIKELSNLYGFKIVEDASHAIGGEYKNEKIGNCKYSDITVFSFHPVKIITTGEGGIALTNDYSINEKIKVLRSHGVSRNQNDFQGHSNEELWNYAQTSLGFNFRITDFQAALGTSQLCRIDEYIQKRHEIAEKYNHSFRSLPIETPWQSPEIYSSYHLYPIKIPFYSGFLRNDVYSLLQDKQIGVNLHYIPIYKHPFYKSLGFKDNYCKEAELYFREILSLPIFPSLTDDDCNYIIDSIQNIFN